MNTRKMTNSIFAVFITIGLVLGIAVSFVLTSLEVEASGTIPAYAGSISVQINNNVPEFNAEEITVTSFEQYGAFDVNSTSAVTSKESSAQTDSALLNKSNDDNGKQSSVGYIANKNTKKFHYPSCDSVKDMKEKNKVYYEGSREGLIDQGYIPCKRCNP